jgi:hypothetical protein
VHALTLARPTAKTEAVQATHEYVFANPTTVVLTADELPQSQVLFAEFQLRGEAQRQEVVWFLPVESTEALQKMHV